jgi:hypothetical protein
MDSLSTLMLGGGFSVGMYRKAMSMHSAAGDGCNYCRCDDGQAIMQDDEVKDAKYFTVILMANDRAIGDTI